MMKDLVGVIENGGGQGCPFPFLTTEGDGRGLTTEDTERHGRDGTDEADRQGISGAYATDRRCRGKER